MHPPRKRRSARRSLKKIAMQMRIPLQTHDRARTAIDAISAEIDQAERRVRSARMVSDRDEWSEARAEAMRDALSMIFSATAAST
jgi:hypothetical protein